VRQLDHVDRFLWYVDSRGTFLRIAELLSETAPEDGEIRENLSAIGAWVEKESDLLSKQAGGPGPTGDVLGGAAQATLLAVSYLRAQAGLQALAAIVPSQPQELKKAVADARKLVDALESDFISGLLIETERRASRDPMFAHRLSEAKEDLRWLGGPLLYLPVLGLTPTPPALGPVTTAAMSHDDWRLFFAVVIVVLVAVSK
jgi:hypothetical protein